MAPRKRPSLRDNITPAADDTARQIEQAAALERLHKDSAQPPADKPAADKPPADKPKAKPARAETAKAEPAVAAAPEAAVVKASPPEAEPAPAEPPAAESPATALPTAESPIIESPAIESPALPEAEEPVPVAAPPGPVTSPVTGIAASDPIPETAASETIMTTSPEIPAAVPTAPAPRSSGVGVTVALGLAVLALAGSGAAVMAPLWSPSAKQSTAAAKALEGRVGTLETRLGTTAPGTPLADRVTALETSLAALDRKVASLPDAKALSAVAVAQVHAALSSSKPFTAELAALRAAAADDPALLAALDKVTPHAAKGIPTHEGVAAKFLTTVPDIITADLAARGGAEAEPAADGISGRVWGWVSGVAGMVRLVAVTAVDTQGTPALLARAGALIEGGELAAAVDLISTLEGGAALAAEAWLKDARARLAANEVSGVLASRAAGQLAK